VSESPALIEVRILSLPVPILQGAREHGDGMMREFALIQLSEADHAGVPRRLLELAGELEERFSGFTAGTEAELAAAEASAATEIDIVYKVPADVSDACIRLGTLLAEADEYCRAGQHLLTLVTPPEAVAFRTWFLEEFVRQVAGENPVPWPAWRAAHPD
jgi:hypothetical protein